MKDGGFVAFAAVLGVAWAMFLLLLIVVDLQKRLLTVEGRIYALEAAQTCQEVEP